MFATNFWYYYNIYSYIRLFIPTSFYIIISSLLKLLYTCFFSHIVEQDFCSFYLPPGFVFLKLLFRDFNLFTWVKLCFFWTLYFMIEIIHNLIGIAVSNINFKFFFPSQLILLDFFLFFLCLLAIIINNEILQKFLHFGEETAQKNVLINHFH